jgi:hypothetical protein
MNASCAALVTSPRSLASSALSADPLLVGLVVKGPSCGLAPSSRPQSMFCQERAFAATMFRSAARPTVDPRHPAAASKSTGPGAAGRARRSRPAGPSDAGATSSSSTPISRDSTRGSSSAGHLCRRRPGPHQRDPDRVAKWGRRHPPTPPRSRAALSHAEHQAILHGGAEDRHHEPEGARMPGRGEVEHQVLLHRRVGNVTWKDHAFADAAEMRAH